eukprot:Rhum_TRINITY_DN13085_c4_g1::Rhum_TRINITY_DN13085_c4_g1_i1::g.56889::m.56889
MSLQQNTATTTTTVNNLVAAPCACRRQSTPNHLSDPCVSDDGSGDALYEVWLNGALDSLPLRGTRARQSRSPFRLLSYHTRPSTALHIAQQRSVPTLFALCSCCHGAAPPPLFIAPQANGQAVPPDFAAKQQAATSRTASSFWFSPREGPAFHFIFYSAHTTCVLLACRLSCWASRDCIFLRHLVSTWWYIHRFFFLQVNSNKITTLQLFFIPPAPRVRRCPVPLQAASGSLARCLSSRPLRSQMRLLFSFSLSFLRIYRHQKKKRPLHEVYCRLPHLFPLFATGTTLCLVRHGYACPHAAATQCACFILLITFQ